MASKGTKLAEAGAVEINRGQFAQAVTTLGNAVKQLVADGELVHVAETLRRLAEAQIAIKDYEAAWKSLESAFQYTQPGDAGDLMIDRAKLLDLVASPHAAEAWRAAVPHLPKSLTTMMCHARAAGCDLRHGRDTEGLDAARALAAEWKTPAQHVAIAGHIATSAVERATPFVAQAMRIMLQNRRAIGRSALHLAIEAAPESQRFFAANIGSMLDLMGVRKALLSDAVLTLMSTPDLTRVNGYFILMKIADTLSRVRCEEVLITQVPIDYWISLGDIPGIVATLDDLYVGMIPDGWSVIAEPAHYNEEVLEVARAFA